MNKKFVSANTLSPKQVKSILLQKIKDEQGKIKPDLADLNLNSKVILKPNKANVDSLFSGAGGLDLGLELAGLDAVIGKEQTDKVLKDKAKYDKWRYRSIFHLSYSNDNFKEADTTYRQMFGRDIVKSNKDIRKVSAFPACQVMVGGFPCPGFSVAGPRLIDDPRNFLYVHYIRALLATQPLFFIGENVKGLLTLANGNVFKQLKEDFASSGYDVYANLVNAKNYGVPESRERVILIGVRRDITQKYSFKYEVPNITNDGTKTPFVTLKNALKGLPANPADVYQSGFSSMYMSRNRKKAWDDVSFTIQASARQIPLAPYGKPMKKVAKDKWFFQGNVNRRLSVRECARIQTFPDWFKFDDGDSGNINTRLAKQYRQIGNAVPVELARKVLRPIAEFLVTHPELLEKSKS